MRKALRIVLFSLLGLSAAAAVLVLVLVYLVFTPSRITPIVRDLLPEYVTCQAEVGEVELTFFSSFPNFGLRLHDVLLVNPVEGASSDTLLQIQDLLAVINLSSWQDCKKVDIKEFRLKNGFSNLYLSSDSIANYDIMASNDSSSTLFLDEISLRKVRFEDFTFSYLNQLSGCSATVCDLAATVEGESRLQKLQGEIDLNIQASSLQYADTSLTLDLRNLEKIGCHLQFESADEYGVKIGAKADSLTVSKKGETPMQSLLTGIDVNQIELYVQDSRIMQGALQLNLDSLEFSQQGTMPLALQLGSSNLQIPHLQIDSAYDVQFLADVSSATLNMDAKGRVLNHLPLRAEGRIDADSIFSAIHLSEASIQADQEVLNLSVDLSLPESNVTRVAAHLECQPTTIGRLIALVPQAYRSSLADIDVRGRLESVKADAEVTLLGENLIFNSLQFDTRVSGFNFCQGSQLQSSIAAFCFSASYPAGEVLVPQSESKRQENHFISARFSGDNLHVVKDDSISLGADMTNAKLQGTISDELLYNSQSIPYFIAQFEIDQLKAESDTLSLETHDLSGSVTLSDGLQGGKQYYQGSFESGDFDITMGSAFHAATGPLQVDASSVYDSQQEDMLLRYNPLLNITFTDGNVIIGKAPYPLAIPSIDFDFNLGRFQIREGKLTYGNSDFSISGDILNLREYLQKKSGLKGEITLNSKQTDVYELMDLTECLSDSTQTIAKAADTTTTETAPFMVPELIDLKFQTNIEQAIVGENDFDNLKGRLSIRDKNLVLEDFSFNSKDARMQLNALYRSPAKDNLFVGANFNLLDAEVSDLIQMIPEIDTIVPMLRSFDGKANFYFAAEANLFGNYQVKMSTLKATAAIEGKDMMLLDGKTFSKISKYLMFNEKTHNEIDTLSVEMAVNRRHATVYPLLLGMDKYQAVISGSHDLMGSMPFNYHISVTQCPLVGGHLGLDIEGDMDNPEAFTYKLVGCKYASLYKPEHRNITQSQMLELKKLIADALKTNVKEQ